MLILMLMPSVLGTFDTFNFSCKWNGKSQLKEFLNFLNLIFNYLVIKMTRKIWSGWSPMYLSTNVTIYLNQNCSFVLASWLSTMVWYCTTERQIDMYYEMVARALLLEPVLWRAKALCTYVHRRIHILESHLYVSES